MKRKMMDIICCPLCKGELNLKLKTEINGDVTEGSMICSKCKREYFINNGIPRMYVSDDEIISLSANSNFPKFTITLENLDRWIEDNKIRMKSLKFFTDPTLTKFLMMSGWILLFISISLLAISYFNFNTSIINKIPMLAIYLLIGISFMFFIIDYLRYRRTAKIEYITNLHILKGLLEEGKLSEYDIRSSTTDKENDFKDTFKAQTDHVDYKGKKIGSILDKYNFQVKSALNVGCGGALHKSVSEPYFNKGYNMIGVDISEEYLKQFSQIFNTDVVQANSMALPFRSNNFDLINFTDVVEHLHHPLIGLSEAQRVLKTGGVIILLTPNHCAFSLRCINPLVFVEKITSLYYDNILPPRVIIERWMDFNFYHTEFSKNEITKLIKAAGFEILSFETQFSHSNMDKINKLFKKLPALKFMCGSFMIIGKKK